MTRRLWDVPLRDGPWRMVRFDAVVPCSTPDCYHQPHARFRWVHQDGTVLCGVCRFANTRGVGPAVRLPDADEPLPGQTTIDDT